MYTGIVSVATRTEGLCVTFRIPVTVGEGSEKVAPMTAREIVAPIPTVRVGRENVAVRTPTDVLTFRFAVDVYTGIEKVAERTVDVIVIFLLPVEVEVGRENVAVSTDTFVVTLVPLEPMNQSTHTSLCVEEVRVKLWNDLYKRSVGVLLLLLLLLFAHVDLKGKSPREVVAIQLSVSLDVATDKGRCGCC